MNCDELVQHNDHVEFEWFPFTSAVLMRQLNRTQVATTKPRRFCCCMSADWYYGTFLRSKVVSWIVWAGKLIPSMVPSMWHFYARKLLRFSKPTVKPSDRQFLAYDVRGIKAGFHEMEYAIALPDARPAVAELRRYIEQHVLQGYYITLPITIRFTAMNHSYLSPAYMRPTCYITVRTHLGHPVSTSFLRGLGELWHRFGGRPSVASLYFVRGPQLRLSFPELDRFNTIRRKLDPNQMFTNDHIDDLLGPMDDPEEPAAIPPPSQNAVFDDDMEKYEI